MKIIRNIITATGVISLSFCIVACTLARRTPLEVTPYCNPLSLPDIGNLRILYEEVLPNKPLNETVWDNAKGPFWDVEESKQIGFTQDYSKFLPVAASAGVIGGAVGGAIAGLTAGPALVNTRIVIPFGSIFSKTLESAMVASTQKFTTCYAPNCGTQGSSQSLLKIKIDQFYVWEEPLNHLNLVVQGRSEYSKDGSLVKGYSFEKSMLKQKLGSMMSTHASFLKEMNGISNKFAQDVVTDIMSNVFK